MSWPDALVEIVGTLALLLMVVAMLYFATKE